MPDYLSEFANFPEKKDRTFTAGSANPADAMQDETFTARPATDDAPPVPSPLRAEVGKAYRDKWDGTVRWVIGETFFAPPYQSRLAFYIRQPQPNGLVCWKRDAAARSTFDRLYTAEEFTPPAVGERFSEIDCGLVQVKTAVFPIPESQLTGDHLIRAVLAKTGKPFTLHYEPVREVRGTDPAPNPGFMLEVRWQSAEAFGWGWGANTDEDYLPFRDADAALLYVLRFEAMRAAAKAGTFTPDHPFIQHNGVGPVPYARNL